MHVTSVTTKILREAAGSLHDPRALQFLVYKCVLFFTQTGDVSDHYPIEFELLGKMNCSIGQITMHNMQYTMVYAGTEALVQDRLCYKRRSYLL